MKKTTTKLPKFTPTFIGPNWTIHSDNGIKELNLSEITLETTLKPGETYITGEENIKRLKNKPLGAAAFKYFWENQDKIPESWKEKINGYTQWVHFDGTILQDSSGSRYVLYLCWYDGAWLWNIYWLGGGVDAYDPSAVLGKSSGLSPSAPSDALSLENFITELETLIKKYKCL